MPVFNSINTRFKLLFALLLVVALPVFIWAVATQRIELRKRAATSEPPVVCWNRVISQGNAGTDQASFWWPNGCKGTVAEGNRACSEALIQLQPSELYQYQQWVSGGRPTLVGCEGPITPSSPPVGQCRSVNDCPANNICSSVPPGGCPIINGQGTRCAQPPRCWEITATIPNVTRTGILERYTTSNLVGYVLRIAGGVEAYRFVTDSGATAGYPLPTGPFDQYVARTITVMGDIVSNTGSYEGPAYPFFVARGIVNVTTSPQPECGSCDANNGCNPGLVCGYVPTPTPNCPNGPSGPCSMPAIGTYQACIKPDGTSQCPTRYITPSQTCTPLPSCAYNADPNGAMCAIPQNPPGGGVWCPRPSPPTCTPLPACAYNTGFSGTNVYCKISATPPNGGSWCPRPVPPPTPMGCYYQQVECVQAPCYPILVCPQTYCPGPNGSSCSVQKCPQPYSCPEGTNCPMYKMGCINQSGTCQNNQCIIGSPPNPITCNYSINPPRICPDGYSCRYDSVPPTYLRTDALGGAGGAAAESTAISINTATTSYWRGRNGVCVPDYPSCGPEGSSCSIGGDCPPQPTCAPGTPCPRYAMWCKRRAGICQKGQCVPPPSPPNISNAGIMTNYNPWSVWIVATNLTTSPMNARLYDTDGSHWGSPIPVTVGSTAEYQFAGFSLPSNTPPSNCNKGKTCTISVDLVPTAGNTSNRFSFTLPSSESITCVHNAPSVTITDPATQQGNPGDTLKYGASFTNNDTLGCDATTYTLSIGVPKEFKVNAPTSTVTIKPQEHAFIPFFLTSPNPNPYSVTLPIPVSVTINNPDLALFSTATGTYTLIQPVPAAFKFRFKFAGVTGDISKRLTDLKETIQIILSPRNGSNYKLSPDLVLSYAGNGVYEANYTVKQPLPPDTEFTLLVKGPKHGAVRFCQQTDQTAPCLYGTYMRVRGNEFDFTGRPLPAGDLDQSGKIDQADVKFVTDLLTKPSSSRKPEDIKRADVNYDGLVDIRDLNLIMQSLSIKQDE